MNRYWKHDIVNGWRKWKGKYDWASPPALGQWLIFDRELDSRKVTAAEGEDILRWGYMPKGIFTIKECYSLSMEAPQDHENPIWRKIWLIHHWPKVAHFI